MNFKKYDLGHQPRGEIVEVTLRGSGANVRLMDSTNLNHYKAGKQHRYDGGLVTKSPHRMVIPRSGHWYVTIDLNGLKAHTLHSDVNVLPGALPKAKPAPTHNVGVSTSSPLASFLHEPVGAKVVNGRIESAPTFDVFISHASEDKDSVARPLAMALQALDVDVWYDEFTLKIGDSLRRKIDEGIANSRFGVIVLSEAFFSKGWPNHELDGLVTRSVDGDQGLLPIWHGLTQKQVKVYSPSLADKLARSTDKYSIQAIADEIAGVINKTKHHDDDTSERFDEKENIDW